MSQSSEIDRRKMKFMKYTSALECIGSISEKLAIYMEVPQKRIKL